MTRQACGRFTRRRFVLGGAAAGAGLAVTRFRLAQAQATPQPAGPSASGHLIDVAAVQGLQADPAFRPVALAGDAAQAQGFIPGSQLVDWHEMELMDTVNEAAVTGWADNMSALFARVGLNWKMRSSSTTTARSSRPGPGGSCACWGTPTWRC